MKEYPFGKTEAEHNAFCDSLKCSLGNYCNFITGLCYEHLAIREKLRATHDNRKRCFMCGCLVCRPDCPQTHQHGTR